MATAAATSVETHREEHERVDRVEEAIRQALEDAGNHMPTAAEILADMALDDEHLFVEMMNPTLTQRARDLVQQFVHASRRAFGEHPPPKRTETAEAGAAAVRALARASIFGFRLPGGLPLRDARRPDLIAGAEVFEKNARTQFRHARFLKLVAEKMQDDEQLVTAQFDEAALRELHELSAEM